MLINDVLRSLDELILKCNYTLVTKNLKGKGRKKIKE